MLLSSTDTIVLKLNTSSTENTVLSCRLLQVVSLAVHLIKIIEKSKKQLAFVHCFHSQLSFMLFQPYSPLTEKLGKKMEREEKLEIKINQKISEVQNFHLKN